MEGVFFIGIGVVGWIVGVFAMCLIHKGLLGKWPFE